MPRKDNNFILAPVKKFVKILTSGATRSNALKKSSTRLILEMTLLLSCLQMASGEGAKKQGEKLAEKRVFGLFLMYSAKFCR